MKKRNCNICCDFFLALMLMRTEATAQPQPRPIKLCVLSQSVLMRDSSIAQRALIEFRSVRGRIMADIADASASVDAAARSLDQLAAAAEPGVVEARRSVLQQRRAEIQARSDAQTRELDSYNARLTAMVNQAAGPAIMAEESSRGCSMLFSREYLLNVTDTSLDITPAVLVRMNAARPSSGDGAATQRGLDGKPQAGGAHLTARGAVTHHQPGKIQRNQ